MTNTNSNKKLQIFLIRHEQLKSYTFTDAVEEKTHIWFKKHKTLDSFEGYWDKEKLGVVIDEFFKTVDINIVISQTFHLGKLHILSFFLYPVYSKLEVDFH